MTPYLYGVTKNMVQPLISTTSSEVVLLRCYMIVFISELAKYGTSSMQDRLRDLCRILFYGEINRNYVRMINKEWWNI